MDIATQNQFSAAETDADRITPTLTGCGFFELQDGPNRHPVDEQIADQWECDVRVFRAGLHAGRTS